MSNRTYDILKWVGITFLPALLTFIGVIGATLDIPYTETILTIGSGFIAFYDTILGIKSIQYHNEKI